MEQKINTYIIGDISLDHINRNSIRGHAREIWTLIKKIPAILSKLLPVSCPLHNFAGIITDLLDICYKTYFTAEDLDNLQETATK